MKKVLFKKLMLDYMSFMFLGLLCTAIVIWVFQAVNYLDIMIEDGRDYLVYINFSLLSFPKIMSKIFPFVLFFSLFYVTIKYELNNELIIFWNFGVHKMQIINFIFKISIMLLLFQLLLTLFVVPKSQDLARSFLRTSTVNFFGNFIKSQKFNDTIKGVTIYSDRKDEEGNLYNLYLKKEIDNNQFQITYAKKGTFKQRGNNPILVLYEGATITSKNNQITNISFSKSDFSLSNLETNTTTYRKTQEISTLNLVKCIKEIYELEKNKLKLNEGNIENCSLQNIRNVLKELYKRLVIPFYIPILALIPFLLITSSKESPKYYKLRLLTFIVGLTTIIFSETTIRFISNETIQNTSLVIIPPILFLILYFFLFFKFQINFKTLKQ